MSNRNTKWKTLISRLIRLKYSYRNNLVPPVEIIFCYTHGLYPIAFRQIAQPTFTSLRIQGFHIPAWCHIRVDDDNYSGEHSHRTVYPPSSFDNHCLLVYTDWEAGFQNQKLLALASRRHLFGHRKGYLTPSRDRVIPPLMISIYRSHGGPI